MATPEFPEAVNHPYVVWSASFLWLISVTITSISLLLFLCIGDLLICTGTEIINIFVFISGIVMFPSNLYMIHMISMNRVISHKAKIGIFPVWICMVLVIVINLVGTAVCIRRMFVGEKFTQIKMSQAMANYRTSHKHKRFIDNMQWTLKCCGLNSYKDWFSRDWYDKSRDYEWEPSPRKRYFKSREPTDSVPLSCCKSGSCISNYLLELGTNSVHTKGCALVINRLIRAYVIVHLIIFIMVALMEVMVFLSVVNWVRARGPDEFWRKRRVFRLAAHYIGRRRNCYSIAVRNVHRALAYATKARKLKKEDMKSLWDTRITAACEQHNMTYYSFKEGLDRANIMLDRKSLSDLASWEPKTFECLAAVAKQKIVVDGLIDGTDKKHPTGINLNLKDVMLEAWLKEKK